MLKALAPSGDGVPRRGSGEYSFVLPPQWRLAACKRLLPLCRSGRAEALTSPPLLTAWARRREEFRFEFCDSSNERNHCPSELGLRASRAERATSTATSA